MRFKTIMDSYLKMLSEKNTLTSYSAYFLSITSWIKNNLSFITDEIIEKNRVDILLKLNVDDYLVDYSDIILSAEKERFEKIKIRNIEELIMIISDTLWEMVTIKSKINCPNCLYDELRFLKVIGKNEKIVLSCETCGWCQNIDSSKYYNEGDILIPACKNDLIEFGLKSD